MLLISLSTFLDRPIQNLNASYDSLQATRRSQTSLPNYEQAKNIIDTELPPPYSF